MNILALDTADQVLSAALSAESGIWYTEIDAGSRHSELLMECIDGLFRIAEFKAGNLNLVACMKGPGSFTGLRIGFSTAKGLCLALGIPLAAVPTLDCLAYPLSIWPGIVLPAIDAKKGCFFTALYRGGERLTDYMDASPETIAKELSKTLLSRDEPVVLTGSGAALLLSSFKAYLLPDEIQGELIQTESKPGRGRARELLDFIKDGKLSETGDLDSGPSYLRKSDAELNLSD